MVDIDDKRGEPETIAQAGQYPAAERRLALLWEPEVATLGGAGRKASLTVRQIVAAAIDIADRGGLESLSMRRVASQLGVGAMTLYTYVPGKVELVDVMLDTVYGELDLPPAHGLPTAPAQSAGDRPAPDRPAKPELASPGAVREGLGQLARSWYAMYLRHPWVLHTNPTRLPLAPHVMDSDECCYRLLLATGLQPRQVVEFAGALRAFVQGYARGAVTEAGEESSADEYWTSMSQFWVTYFDERRYPSMVTLWQAGAFDRGEADFEEALVRLFDLALPAASA